MSGLNLFLQSGNVPQGASLPGNLQALINDVAQYVLIAGAANVGGLNFGNVTPSPENRAFPWWKTDVNNNPLGMYSWNGSAWVTTPSIIANGPTISRPLSPSLGTLYLDTTINCMLIFERNQWRTVSGSPGDTKEVKAATIDAALTANPGWIQDSDSNGCVIGGAGANAGHSLTTRAYGSFSGEETHIQTINEMPAHTHTTQVNWGSGGEGGGDNPLYYDDAQAPASPQSQPNTGATGSGQPFNMLQPTIWYWRLVKQ